MSRRSKHSIDLGLAILCTSNDSFGNPRPGGCKSLSEIALYCGCSRERIRQIADRGLRKIRNGLYEAGEAEEYRELLDALEKRQRP